MSKPPSRSNSKNENPGRSSLASIYDSWMDANSVKSIESRETSTPKPQKKKKSNFKFDKRYTEVMSVTPEIPRTPSPQQFVPTPQMPKPKPKPKKNLQNPMRSTASSPIIFKDYNEFYDWVFNGDEDDINPTEIERMLFKNSKNQK